MRLIISVVKVLPVGLKNKMEKIEKNNKLIPYFGKFQPGLYINTNLEIIGEKRDALVDFKNIRDIELNPIIMSSGKIKYILTGNYTTYGGKRIFDTNMDKEHFHQLICVWYTKPEVGLDITNLDKDDVICYWRESSNSGNSGYDHAILSKNLSINLEKK